MNKTISTIIVLLAVALTSAYWFISRNTSSRTPLVTTNIAVKEFDLPDTSSDSSIHYHSTPYHFSFELPKFFNSSTPSSRNIPPSTSALFTVGFARTNPNTSTTPNRDTPNKFNTAPDDSFALTIYPNDSRITSSDLTKFRSWRKAALYDDATDTITILAIGRFTTLKATQADGIDSFGLYYYFIQPDFIYVFNTDDFPDAAMQTYLGFFNPTASS